MNMPPSSSSSSFVLAAASFLILWYAICKFLQVYWWKPTALQRALRRQGIGGTKYRLFSGDVPDLAAMIHHALSHPMHHLSHDIMPRVLPHLAYWSKLYGLQFVHWNSATPMLTLHDPTLVREALSNRHGRLEKPPALPEATDLLGTGLILAQGDTWALHRRLVSPAFRMDKLKAMIPAIVQSANAMFDKWQLQHLLQSSGEAGHRTEIEVSKEFQALTADVIARTAFGSSFEEGKLVFELQYEQQILVSEATRTVYIPGIRFLPTPKNQRRWLLDKKIRKSLGDIIHSRLTSASGQAGRGSDLFGDDLLGMLLTANKECNDKNSSLSIDDIIDECKTFFFAGHDTTSGLLTWTTMLLAHHPYWQEQARGEVLALFGTNAPTVDGTNHLKVVTMVLNESLRLYPSAVILQRYAYEDVKLGKLDLPKGTGLVLPILAIHHSPDLWGDDVHEFKPERFAEGVANAAKQPLAFMPFSTGPRFCVGQNFAILEAKLVLAVMLQRFSFHLSPAYRHAPTVIATLQPQYGVQIMIESIVGRSEKTSLK